MKRPSRRISAKTGSTPGSLIYIGVERRDPVTIDVIQYDSRELKEFRARSIDEINLAGGEQITWINIEGVHDIGIVEAVGKKFNVHPLMLEDIVNTNKRPKFEDGGDYLLLMMKMLYTNPKCPEIITEQVSLIIGANYVISFQEVAGDVFDPIRERLRKTLPKQRFMGSDYLTHSLIDAIVDHYFIVLEHVGDWIESLEQQLVNDPRSAGLKSIYDLKRMLVDLRRSAWPLREVIGAFERSDSELIHDYTRLYMRDLYEHVIQVADTVDSNREMVSNLLDIYLTSVNNRTNEVMRLLTVITTIFAPLTFLVGIYGMNFDTQISPFNMPELEMKYGYVYFWIVTLGVIFALVWFFRRKKWL